MASPLTHIILAIKIVCLLPGSMDQQAFIVGTSFPDIRHMAGLSREATHIEPVSWNDVITEPSSFRAGMLFHNLVDNLRIASFEPFFYDRSSFDYDASYISYFPLVMKFAEDALLYSKAPPHDEICNYFDTIYQEELALCPDKEIVEKWHNQIKNYCSEKPSLPTINTFLSAVGKLTFTNTSPTFDCAFYFTELIKSVYFRQRLFDFYDNFEKLITIHNYPVSYISN